MGKVRQDRGTRRSGWQAGDPKKSIWADDAQRCPGWAGGKVLTERLSGSIYKLSQAEPWCSAMAGWSRLAGNSRRS